jgi:hypothetical protein
MWATAATFTADMDAFFTRVVDKIIRNTDNGNYNNTDDDF